MPTNLLSLPDELIESIFDCVPPEELTSQS